MPEPKDVAQILVYAGGSIVGKTRLQKIAYLLEISGMGPGYKFSYHYYGPYSSELDSDANIAWAFDLIHREDRTANWGGTYSIFSIDNPALGDSPCSRLAKLAVDADAVVLELAATAAFLSHSYADPWEETINRKPDKATVDRLNKAKAFYRRLKTVPTPVALPDIVPN